jgi:hypothetical protein
MTMLAVSFVSYGSAGPDDREVRQSDQYPTAGMKKYGVTMNKTKVVKEHQLFCFMDR